MRLTDKRITEFQRLYKKRFGQNISQDKAIEQGTALMQVVQSIYKPISRNEYKAFIRRKRKRQNDKKE